MMNRKRHVTFSGSDIDHFPRVIVHFPEVIDQFAGDIDHFPRDINHFPSYIVISGL
ncbi:hypothetical protein [Sporosarcina luteola]|uniref:hypothetical protein n=1 Tax=Sporosarcina luteola TaxID=582850 RepID=UPI00203C15DA|nr:hypothetical protein [Sporosarcina luteola]MCM3711535.1 hypothetical protein [Sporosarcina luteola]